MSINSLLSMLLCASITSTSHVFGSAHLYAGLRVRLAIGLSVILTTPGVYSFEGLSQRNGRYLRKHTNLSSNAVSASCTSVMGLFIVMDPGTIALLVLISLQSQYDHLPRALVASSPLRQQQQQQQHLPVNKAMACCRRHQRQL